MVGAYWSLHFEEPVLWRDKGFMELHSTSTLDTRGNNLTSKCSSKEKSDVSAGKATENIWNVERMPKGHGIKKV
jgi:hypothetical protein